MKDIKELASLFKSLEDDLIRCMKCGFCQSVCPLYAQTFNETDYSRGKIATLEGLANNILSETKTISKKLDRCVTCGSCEAYCPSGVNTLDIFLKARVILTEYNGLNLYKKIMLRKILSNPKTFNRFLNISSKIQDLFVTDANNLLETSCIKYFSILKNRHIKKLNKTPFHEVVKKQFTQNGNNKKIKVIFFYGCVIDWLLPSIGHATVNSLNSHGVNLNIPEQLICCGIPALSSGDIETFTKILKEQTKQLENQEFDYIITSCATCCYTIKKLWPKFSYRLNNKEKALINNFASKAIDISDFLINILNISNDKNIVNKRYTITYHDPCHLKKSLGISTEPRQIIKLSGHLLEEMNEADWCCGSGGTFNLQHYDLSTNIAKRKLNNIDHVNPDIVATSCPACILQITDLASQYKKSYKIKHVIELLN